MRKDYTDLKIVNSEIIIIIQIFQYRSPPESDEALLSKSHRMIALISYYVNSRLLLCIFFFLLFHLLLLNHYQCQSLVHVHNKRMFRGWVVMYQD